MRGKNKCANPSEKGVGTGEWIRGWPMIQYQEGERKMDDLCFH